MAQVTHLTLDRMAVLIQETLEARGISQAEFARQVGCTQKHMSRVLLGHQHAAMNTLDYWAFVLGLRFEVTLVERA